MKKGKLYEEQCERICENLLLKVLTQENIDEFLSNCDWLDKEHFRKICELYGLSEIAITIIIDEYYIDVAYRDLYYNYWSKSHFNWPRSCRRLFLFQNEHSTDEFFKNESECSLNDDFLGTIVIRPSYSKETDHTFGRTILNPYKMSIYNQDGRKIHPYIYLATAEYKVHLLGHIFKVSAFPFCSQDGVAMRCAETSIYALCDFYSTSSVHARVLPSEIYKKLEQRLSERILPSHGLYCNDISYILREFKFSPLVYASISDAEAVGN